MPIGVANRWYILPNRSRNLGVSSISEVASINVEFFVVERQQEISLVCKISMKILVIEFGSKLAAAVAGAGGL